MLNPSFGKFPGPSRTSASHASSNKSVYYQIMSCMAEMQVTIKCSYIQVGGSYCALENLKMSLNLPEVNTKKTEVSMHCEDYCPYFQPELESKQGSSVDHVMPAVFETLAVRRGEWSDVSV